MSYRLSKVAFLYDIYTLLMAQNGKSWNECRIKIEIYPFHTTLMQKPKDIDAKNIKKRTALVENSKVKRSSIGIPGRNRTANDALGEHCYIHLTTETY